MAGRVAARAEPLYLLALAPLLLFPTFRPGWTAAGLAGLALLWLARAVIRREMWPVTPFNPALLVFCLSLPLAVWASPAPDLTLPKLTGVILGLAVFRAVAFHARDRRGLLTALAALGAAGLAIWAVGLLGLRLPQLQPLSARLPAALIALPGAEAGINPNQLAGALVILLPLALGCAVGLWQAGRKRAAALLGLVTVPALGTLALTQSRAGWVGFALAGLGLVLAFAWLGGSAQRRRAIAIGAGVILLLGGAGAAVLLARGAGGVGGEGIASQDGGVLEQLSLDARVEIWSRAVYALQDFPFTGVGLGAFRRVVNLLYPLFLAPPDMDIGHSHNMFLQVGVDLGLIGLVGYVALLIIAAVMAWQSAREERGLTRGVALGALAALVGLHVYGLADALALGSKPSVVFWAVLGLIAGLSGKVDVTDT